MANAGKASDLRTVTVIESETMVRPDGRAGIRLVAIDEESREQDTIVFEVTLEMITTLRTALTLAEMHIRQSENQTRN